MPSRSKRSATPFLGVVAHTLIAVETPHDEAGVALPPGSCPADVGLEHRLPNRRSGDHKRPLDHWRSDRHRRIQSSRTVVLIVANPITIVVSTPNVGRPRSSIRRKSQRALSFHIPGGHRVCEQPARASVSVHSVWAVRNPRQIRPEPSAWVPL